MEDLYFQGSLVWCEDTAKCIKALRETVITLEEEAYLKTQLADLYEKQLKIQLATLSEYAKDDEAKQAALYTIIEINEKS